VAPVGSSSARVRSAPVQLTSFIGREREIAAIQQALAGSRLLTLTGAGGSGKTRLALEVATREVEASGHGGAWVELAALESAERLADTILAALGVRDESRAPDVERIARAIGDEAFLLVIDNAEHLVAACASLVHGLLAACPRLRVLVTSRAALGVAGETAWLVPPLSMAADPSSGDDPEAVQLFVQRGQAASASFRLTSENRADVTRICRRLDGLPLALELAAARLRVLPPRELAARLDDRFRLLVTGNRAALPRQQTLRATIDWSYDALREAERVLFDRLSVFRGTFSVDAVEAVAAGGPVAADDVLDLLAALVDQSLVEFTEHDGGARYHLLESMREYAHEKLDADGELDERLHAHARFYGELARELEPLLRTPQRSVAMARLRLELENLRHAVHWSRQGNVPLHLRIVGLLHWFWFGTGQWPEAQDLLREALAMPEAVPPTMDRAALLFSAGSIAALQAKGQIATTQLEEAEAIAEQGDDPRLLANIRNYLGMALHQSADPRAIEVLLRARPWMREANDLNALRLNFLLHGQALAFQGDLAGAVETTEEAVRVARVFGPERELGISLQQLATMVARTGDWPRARALVVEALENMRRDPMLLFVARGFELMGSSASVAGAVDLAATLYGAGEAIRTMIGAAMWQLDIDQHAPHMRAAQERLGEDAWRSALERGRALDMEGGIALALSAAAQLGRETEPDPTRQTGEYRAPLPARPVAVRGDTPALSVRALGRLEVLVDGAPVGERDWKYARTRELLLYLLVHKEGRTRDQIGLALWPEASATQVRNNLHVALHHLRRALGHAEWIRFDRDRYRVDVTGGLAFDAAEFEQGVTEGLRKARRGNVPLEALSDALSLYRGDFLQDESVGDWHFEMRDRLSRLHREALEALGVALAAAGRDSDAIDVLERLVEQEPLHEAGYRALMQVRAKSGDRVGARRAYQRLEEALRREGYGEPGRETQELHRRLLG